MANSNDKESKTQEMYTISTSIAERSSTMVMAT